MGINTFGRLFMPKNKVFYELFEGVAEKVLEMARAGAQLLDVREGELALRYGDLWRMARGGPLAIGRVQAQDGAGLFGQGDGRARAIYSLFRGGGKRHGPSGRYRSLPCWREGAFGSLRLPRRCVRVPDGHRGQRRRLVLCGLRGRQWGRQWCPLLDAPLLWCSGL